TWGEPSGIALTNFPAGRPLANQGFFGPSVRIGVLSQTPVGSTGVCPPGPFRPRSLSKERCFVRFDKIVCWEPSDVNTPMVQAAGRLYEQTLAADERIPWAWIERSVGDRDRPGGWNKHLILTAPEGRTDDPAALAGYVYGAFLPGYGGYLCYVGVADWARRMGVGTTLYGAFYD